jgi:hypothetical protein
MVALGNGIATIMIMWISLFCHSLISEMSGIRAAKDTDGRGHIDRFAIIEIKENLVDGYFVDRFVGGDVRIVGLVG